MREIKFRAWTGQQMEYNIMAGFLGTFYVQGIDENDLASMSQFNSKYPNNTPVMQFTGLHDKNGKEIYEGDIWFMNGLSSQPMIVCFDEGKFCSKSKWGNYPKRDHGYTYWNLIDGEIIGNIYENPELLNN